VTGVAGAVLTGRSPDGDDREVAVSQLRFRIATVERHVVFNEFGVAAE
jgi:hypothetical protein